MQFRAQGTGQLVKLPVRHRRTGERIDQKNALAVSFDYIDDLLANGHGMPTDRPSADFNRLAIPAQRAIWPR